MSGISALATIDTKLPNAGTPQQYHQIEPLDYPRSNILLINMHGSKGSAGTYMNPVPSNDPAHPGDLSYTRREWIYTFPRSGVTVVSPDLYTVNPVTGLRDINAFGNTSQMAQLDYFRTVVAPQLGCRSDLIALHGASQGSVVMMNYTLQWPEHVAALFITFGSGDIEIDRFSGFADSINDNWIMSRGTTGQFTLGIGGPQLTGLLAGVRSRLFSPWAAGQAYVVNDVVISPGRVPNSYDCAYYRCINAHTSAGSFPGAGSTGAAANWQEVDPLTLHYQNPHDSVAGTSLTFSNFTSLVTGGTVTSPLHHKSASMSEPANIARMASIVDGSLPALGGRRVPVLWRHSEGDRISNGFPTNGISSGASKWLAAQWGCDFKTVSQTGNHGGITDSPETIDASQQTTTTIIHSGGYVWTASAQEVMFIISGSWTGTLTFQGSVDGTTWTTVPVPSSGNAGPWVRSTVSTRANSDGWAANVATGTEGVAISSTTGNGYFRMSTDGYQKVRVLASAWTGGTATVTCGPTYPADIQTAAIDATEFAVEILHAA